MFVRQVELVGFVKDADGSLAHNVGRVVRRRTVGQQGTVVRRGPARRGAAAANLDLAAVDGLRIDTACDHCGVTRVNDRDTQAYQHRTHVLVGLAVAVRVARGIAAPVFLVASLAGSVVEQGAQQALARPFKFGISRFEPALVQKPDQRVALGERVLVAHVDGVAAGTVAAGGENAAPRTDLVGVVHAGAHRRRRVRNGRRPFTSPVGFAAPAARRQRADEGKQE